MTQILFTFFINVLDFLILRKYLLCFGKKKRFTPFISMLIFAICVITLTIFNQMHEPHINLVCSFTLIFLYSLSFSYSFPYQIIFPCLYFGTGFVTEPLGLLLTQNFCQYIPFHWAYNISVILCEISRFLIISIVCQIWRNLQLPILSSNISRLLFLIPIPNIIVCCICIYIAKHLETGLANILCLTVIFTVLLSSLLTFVIFHKLGLAILSNHKNELLLQEASAKEEYFHEVEKSNTIVREIKHDLKNQLIGLSALAEGAPALTAEFQKIIGGLKNSDKTLYTNNSTCNTIVNNKIQIAQSKNIECSVSLLIPEYLSLDYSDICVLLGNLFDNAIEACEKVCIPDRKIVLSIVYMEHILTLKIVNSKELYPAIWDKSSKPDFLNHGIGIRSVKRIVEKYNGVLDITDDEYSFEVSAILYGITSVPLHEKEIIQKGQII